MLQRSGSEHGTVDHPDAHPDAARTIYHTTTSRNKVHCMHQRHTADLDTALWRSGVFLHHCEATPAPWQDWLDGPASAAAITDVCLVAGAQGAMLLWGGRWAQHQPQYVIDGRYPAPPAR